MRLQEYIFESRDIEDRYNELKDEETSALIRIARKVATFDIGSLRNEKRENIIDFILDNEFRRTDLEKWRKRR